MQAQAFVPALDNQGTNPMRNEPQNPPRNKPSQSTLQPFGEPPERAVELLVREIQEDTRKRQSQEVERLRQRLFDLD